MYWENEKNQYCEHHKPILAENSLNKEIKMITINMSKKETWKQERKRWIDERLNWIKEEFDLENQRVARDKYLIDEAIKNGETQFVPFLFRNPQMARYLRTQEK